jgi:type II secretory pathway predicted ATPase ExeA
MYESRFHFRQRPFCSLPAAEHYFPASAIDDALSSVRMCLERASGPAAVFGQPGWGKSLLLAVLSRDFCSHFRVVNVAACTRLSRRHDLLQNILFELGQPYRELSEGELRLALIDYLKSSAQCPNGILLLVDDAQGLPARVLDELRLLSNYVRDGQPRVRLAFAGTMSLEERLQLPQLEPLNQRIACRGYLQSLRRDEIEAYVSHHVLRAGRPRQDIFLASALAALAQWCDGNPRTINQVCDHALILAAASGQSTVNGDTIAEALSDIQRIPASLWLASQQPKSISGQEKADGSWSVVEFGSIDERPTEGSAGAETPANEPASDPESFEDVEDSVDEFSELVESLSTWYTRETEADALPAEEARREIPPSEVAAFNPFAETFAEEYVVQDNYALLSAKHNLDSTQISAGEIAMLREHIDRHEGQPVSLLSTTPVLPIEASIDRKPALPLEFPIDTSAALSREEPAPVHPEWYRDVSLAEYSPTSEPEVREEKTRADDREPNRDDRDILIVAETAHPAAPADKPTLELGSNSVSRGQALRLEYGHLFQRLRGDSIKT